MSNLTYEQAITRLEEIVSMLEEGNLSLDESIKLFEESAKLSAYCSDLLNKAETRITEFLKNSDGDNDE